MADLKELKQLLVAADLDLDGFEVRRSGELRVSVPRQKLTQFADYLRALNLARPELIVAEDTRSEDGGFTLRYIFALERAAEWVIACGIRLIGIDYLSIEPFDGDGTVHRLLLRAGVIPLETLDLRAAGAGPYTLLCLPLDLPLADGAPCRAVLAPLGRPS